MYSSIFKAVGVKHNSINKLLRPQPAQPGRAYKWFWSFWNNASKGGPVLMFWVYFQTLAIINSDYNGFTCHPLYYSTFGTSLEQVPRAGWTHPFWGGLANRTRPSGIWSNQRISGRNMSRLANACRSIQIPAETRSRPHRGLAICKDLDRCAIALLIRTFLHGIIRNFDQRVSARPNICRCVILYLCLKR